MKTRIVTILICLALTALVTSTAHSQGATKVTDALWAFDKLYGTVLTPTTFMSPPLNSTDKLYNFGMSGLSGQRSVAESAPGYRDYNGGRWNVQMVVYTPQGLSTFDPDGDKMVNLELTNVDDVLAYEASGDLVIAVANFFFECPLIRSH